MSYDPNADQNPEANYNKPDYANPRSYENPNTPHETSNPYGAPDTPYNTPNPYAYGAPETPYGTPPNAAYSTPDNAYAAGLPPRGPLPLGEAIRELPGQYTRVVTKPGTAVFAEEQGKAAWNIIWVQLIVLAIFTGLITLGAFNLSVNNAMMSSSSAASSQVLQTMKSFSGGFALLFLIFTPIGFFIGTGIYYLFARAFGGRGTYLAHCYCYLLLAMPLGIVGGILGLIPFIGSILALAASVYQIILQVYMTMAVHRLSGGRATLAVLIFPIIVIVLSIIVGIIAIAAIAGAMSR